jgi:hypothetical protein
MAKRKTAAERVERVVMVEIEKLKIILDQKNRELEDLHSEIDGICLVLSSLSSSTVFRGR